MQGIILRNVSFSESCHFTSRVVYWILAEGKERCGDLNNFYETEIMLVDGEITTKSVATEEGVDVTLTVERGVVALLSVGVAEVESEESS